MEQQTIESQVKSFILERFLPNENPDDLAVDTPLVTGGILDSLATLEIVSFVEETYGIKVEAHEVNVDNMDSVARISEFVRSKHG